MGAKFFLRLGLIVLGVSLLVFAGWFVFSWRSLDINRASKRSIHSCIYDGKHHTDTIESMGNEFVVSYVENADADCINPGFPSIHITTEAEHTAWLHIVRTDCSQGMWQQFIDTVDQKQCPSVFPFYTLDQDFYDAPCWHYTLWDKFSFWRGHAYAVHVDHQEKTVRCVGGVAWGYELFYSTITPRAIEPYALAAQDWKRDWDIFNAELPGYNLLEQQKE